VTVPLRAALNLRVSTARQAEHDVSIPDQKRQSEAYCASRGYQHVETYVEPGASATNDRRPEFQRTIEAGTAKPAPFDIVIVDSFSRFFRDHFELEFCVRKLAKNGVELVSITQEMPPCVGEVVARIGLEPVGARTSGSGSIWTGVQGPNRGATVAAGEFVGGAGVSRGWSECSDTGALACGCVVQWIWRSGWRQSALDGGGSTAGVDRHSCDG
jgi:Resolvase, N terminal domain